MKTRAESKAKREGTEMRRRQKKKSGGGNKYSGKSAIPGKRASKKHGEKRHRENRDDRLEKIVMNGRPNYSETRRGVLKEGNPGKRR